MSCWLYIHRSRPIIRHHQHNQSNYYFSYFFLVLYSFHFSSIRSLSRRHNLQSYRGSRLFPVAWPEKYLVKARWCLWLPWVSIKPVPKTELSDIYSFEERLTVSIRFVWQHSAARRTSEQPGQAARKWTESNGGESSVGQQTTEGMEWVIRGAGGSLAWYL
jgi:hypothetical protein